MNAILTWILLFQVKQNNDLLWLGVGLAVFLVLLWVTRRSSICSKKPNIPKLMG